MNKTVFLAFASALLTSHRVVLLDAKSEIGSYNDLIADELTDQVFDIKKSAMIVSKNNGNIGTIHLTVSQSENKEFSTVSIKSYDTNKQMETVMAMAKTYQQ